MQNKQKHSCLPLKQYTLIRNIITLLVAKITNGKSVNCDQRGGGGRCIVQDGHVEKNNN